MRHQHGRVFVGVLLVASFAVSLVGRGVQAATITVNTTDMSLTSDSKCGFAEALVAVNTKAAAYGCPAGTGNDTIQLQAATYQPLGSLEIERGVTIKGAAPDPALGLMTNIDSQNLTSLDEQMFYLIELNGAMSVTLTNVALNGPLSGPNQLTGIYAEGSSSASTVHVLGCYVYGFTYGGIWAIAFNVDVQDSYVALNRTPGSGGGIFFDAPSKNLTVSRTTFDSNTSAANGGGIEYQGVGTSSVVGSTFSSNTADFGGGGIDIEGEGGSFAISQSTLVFNSCAGSDACGGGVLSQSGAYSVSFSMNASLVADNTGMDPNFGTPTVSDFFSDGNITVSNSDILGNTQPGVLYRDGGGNHMGLDPQASIDLTSLGGLFRLPVSVLPAGSPVLDVLSTLSPGVDERGFTRGVSKTTGLTGSNLFDIGAFEFDPNTETETMVLVGSSGNHTTANGSTFSAGKTFELQATKAGNFAAFFLPTIIEDAQPPCECLNYNFVAGFATGPTEGIVQLETSIDSTFKTGVVAIGSPVDLYAKTAGTLKKNYNVSIPLSDNNSNYVRLRVTGKNSKSSGYAVYSDYINALTLNG
jgi:predicted outer membrane repeat protein